MQLDQLTQPLELNDASRAGPAVTRDNIRVARPRAEQSPPILSPNALSSRSSIPTWVTTRLKRG